MTAVPAAWATLYSETPVSAMMSGLSGFGFSAIGALCLWLLPPKLGVPLLMTLSSANQLMSLRQLKQDMRPVREWWPEGPAPYLLGGLAGVPIGLSILHALPTLKLMAVFGGFLLVYAAYSMLKPEGLHVQRKSSWPIAALVGMAGGGWGSEFAVDRESSLEGDEGSAMLDEVGEGVVQVARGLFEDAERDFDVGGSEFFNSLAADQRIGVLCGDDAAGDAGSD